LDTPSGRVTSRRAPGLWLLAGCAGCSPLGPPPSPPVPALGVGAPTLSAASSAGPRPVDAGAVVHVDFEDDPLGAYTPARLIADWGAGSAWSQGLTEGRASIVATDRGRSLRVLYPRGSVGPSQGGAQFFVPVPGAHDELDCSYRVRFASGFDFVRGGKLPGLVGGSHPTGGHPADDGFSARLMWRPGGAAVQYVYYPRQTTTYGVDLPYLFASGAPAQFQPGTWHRVEHRIVLNAPGQAHGVLQAWFDGQRVLDLHDRVWRLDDTVHIDALYFSTFFGGNDASWGATRDETVDFDDFVIAQRPSRE
jgi:hypothetical protein